MLRSGNRLLVLASLGLIAIAALQTVSLLSPAPTGGELGRLVRDMRGLRMPMGLGMETTVWSLTRNPSLAMTLLLVWVGAQNLFVLACRPDDARLSRLIKLSGAGFSWILTAVAAAYRVAPSLLSLGLVAVLFSLSLLERSALQDSARSPQLEAEQA